MRRSCCGLLVLVLVGCSPAKVTTDASTADGATGGADSHDGLDRAEAPDAGVDGAVPEPGDGGVVTDGGEGVDTPPAAADGAASDPMAPACALPRPKVSTAPGCVVEPSGDLTSSSIHADVVVVAVADGMAPGCANQASTSSPEMPGRSVTLSLSPSMEGRKPLTLVLRIPDLPDDLVRPGDTFHLDLTVSLHFFFVPRVDQTFVLSRQGQVIVFGAKLSGSAISPAFFPGDLLPSLDPFDVHVSDGGISCQTPIAPFASGCGVRDHRARVTVGGDSTLLESGATARIGGLLFANHSYFQLESQGGCDGESITLLSAYAVASAMP